MTIEAEHNVHTTRPDKFIATVQKLCGDSTLRAETDPMEAPDVCVSHTRRTPGRMRC
jgi:hypothetical protein